MQLSYDYKIIEKPLHFFYEEGNFLLPKSLSEKNYSERFNVLKNLDLLGIFAINMHKLTSNYFHLLE